jgi:hypothetical protein
VSQANNELVAENACVYFNELKWLTVRRLSKLNGVKVVSSDAGFLRPPSKIVLKIGEDSIELHCTHGMGGLEKVKSQRSGLAGWVQKVGASQNPQEIDFICGYIGQVTQLYGIKPSRRFTITDSDPIWRTILGIASIREGLVFVLDSLVDFRGNLMTGFLRELGETIRKEGSSKKE